MTMLTPDPKPPASGEDDIPEPPTIEIPYGEALEVLLDKQDYSEADVRIIAAYARKRRQEQAARELRREEDARMKAAKKEQAEAKKQAKAAKDAAKAHGSINADEGKTIWIVIVVLSAE